MQHWFGATFIFYLDAHLPNIFDTIAKLFRNETVLLFLISDINI